MKKLALDNRGDLVVSVGKSKIVEHAPEIYQESGGEQTNIKGGWKFHGAHEAGFRVGELRSDQADCDRSGAALFDLSRRQRNRGD